jgi:hypothetical protein
MAARRGEPGSKWRARSLALAVSGIALVAVAALVVVVLRGGKSPSTTQSPHATTTTAPRTAKPPRRPKPKPKPPANRTDFPLPAPTRNDWHTYVVDIVFGRTDGTTARPGALRVWVDGADTPAIDVHDVNTLQRVGDRTQRWMQLWEGDYTQDLQQVATQDLVLTRIGRTLQEALLDRPTLAGKSAERYSGTGENLGPPGLTAIGTVPAAATRVPASLGANDLPPDPLDAYQVKLTPNYVLPSDDLSSNYQAVWAYARSPTTPWRSPDSHHVQGRYLLVDPRSKDEDGRAGADEAWLVIERRWPSSFDPSAHGRWGTLVNLHNVAGDVGWSDGSGVSAVALVWLPHSPAPAFHLEYNG